MPNSPTGLYLEDLQEGQSFTSDSLEVDAQQIVEFASSFDPQPFHTDAVAAEGTFFGGLAASGWHTAALTMRLLVGHGAPFAVGLIGAGAQIEWPRPTRPGDVLHARTEVLKITPSRSRPDRGMVLLRTDTLNQRGEIVQVLTSTAVVTRRPQASAG
ncbi:MAG: MaoC family dehydratase [Rhodocyclaceae bacterium]|nr:MaoC family dehydratase [Rhodocyclaceae bacterium]